MRRNCELGRRVQQLEEENRLHRESSAGLKDHLARVEAGQQSEVARLQETITAGGSKVKEDLSNVQGELTKMKEEIRQLEMKQFPPSVKKRKLRLGGGKETDEMYDIPDGIIAHLTRECRGHVHDRNVLEVTSGSFEKESNGANPHSGAFNNDPKYAAKNAADLDTGSFFRSAYRWRSKGMGPTKNNWLCYDFKERRIAPTHYTIRTNEYYSALKSWLVETSVDGKRWREVGHNEEDEKELKGMCSTAIFAVARAGKCRFIRLVNIGRNHFRNDCLAISAWEIFGSIIE
jgi:hypothetical protein